MKAYLVFGPESSGTRFFTEMFINAGCYGDSGHNQRLDNKIEGENIVWRRSFPHFIQKEYVDIEDMLEQLDDYDVTVIVTMRDWHAMAGSQVRNRHGVDSGEKAIKNIKRAYKHIFKSIIDNDLDFVTVNYEQITQRGQEGINKFLNMFGLVGSIKVKDGNKKYYES